MNISSINLDIQHSKSNTHSTQINKKYRHNQVNFGLYCLMARNYKIGESGANKFLGAFKAVYGDFCIIAHVKKRNYNYFFISQNRKETAALTEYLSRVSKKGRKNLWKIFMDVINEYNVDMSKLSPFI